MPGTVAQRSALAVAAREIRSYKFDVHRTPPDLSDDRIEFAPSLRFELFYALASLFDRTARVHPAWRARARRDLPDSFWREARVLGPARELWIVLPAVLPHDAPLSDWESLSSALGAADSRELARAMLKGLLHANELVDEMLRSGCVRRAMQRAPRAELGWLRTLGLVPYRRAAPLARAFESLVEDPVEAIGAMRRIARQFWHRSFAPAFLDAQAQYAAAARGLREYWRATSLSEVLADSLLRVRLNGDVLEAIEGRYRVHLRDVEKMVVLPSAFNERRYWSAVAGERGSIVYLPWFEPSLAVSPPRDQRSVLPALRALADESRWKMIRALLRAPRSASELAALCELGKATVSHHVRVLAEADLVTRGPRRGKVLLNANREVILRLGDRIVSQADG